MEIWKVINNCPTHEVSSYGRIRKTKSKYVLKCATKKGYIILRTKNYQKMVHRIVAEHFIENTMNKPYINHIDSNRANNHIDNLEWVTPLENTLHGVYLGNIKCRKIRNNDTGEIYESKGVAAIKLGVKRGVIKAILRGATKNRFNISVYED